MRRITAIIQPYQLHKVTTALVAVDLNGVTISEAQGSGRQKGHAEVYRGVEYRADYVPVRIEALAADAEAP